LKTIYSVGHSSHDWSTFILLLDAAGIGVVIDVRSNPASRLPHFNRTALKERLNAVGIGYVFLGLELGGRPPKEASQITSRWRRAGCSPRASLVSRKWRRALGRR
jgi:uncharacterized protein (DUF488 family)